MQILEVDDQFSRSKDDFGSQTTIRLPRYTFD